MKLLSSSFLSVAVLGTLVACSSSPKPAVAPVPTATATTAVQKKDSLSTPKDRYSYALGMDMGRAIKNVEADIDEEIFLRSLRDQIDNKPLLMTDSQAEKALQELVLQMQVQKEKKAAESAQKALDSQKTFLDKNKLEKGVITTASGLQYKIITAASDSGKAPKLTDKVRVHYAGSLLDGTEFDSSIKRGEPLEFPVNAVIQGWQELLTLMKEGEKVKAWIPSSLGYGTDGASPVIPPNALLVFEVELLKVLPSEPAAVEPAKVVDTSKTVKKSEKEKKADSLATVKAAKKVEADSIAAVKAARADSLKAVKAAKDKATADSIAAVKAARADSLKAVQAQKKATADSLKAVKAEKEKAKADSIAAVKATKADTSKAVPAKK